MSFGLNKREKLPNKQSNVIYCQHLPRIRKHPVICSLVVLAFKVEVHTNIEQLELVPAVRGTVDSVRPESFAKSPTFK